MMTGSPRMEKDKDQEDHTNNHLHFMSQRLERMVNMKEMSDTVFRVDGEEVYASSFILTAASDYFESLLAKSSKNGVAGQPIEIDGIDKATFELCLRYLYCGKAEINADNAGSVFCAADRFSIEPLRNACGQMMVDAIDEGNCFSYLSAAEGLPAGQDLVRTACLDFIENNLYLLYLTGVDIRETVKTINYRTMLDICTRIGLGIRHVAHPAECLLYAMDAVLAWGEFTFGGKLTIQGLYNHVNALTYEILHAKGACVDESHRTFKLTEGQLRGDNCFVSEEFKAANYSFAMKLTTNERKSGHIGAYLTPVSKSGYPDWWQCHALYVISAPAVLKTPTSGHFCNAVENFNPPRAHGTAKFIPHSSLPTVTSVDSVSDDSVRIELPLSATIIINSILSLCTAYTFFHPELWPVMDNEHLNSILCLDSLPVESEDALLTRLLSFGGNSAALEPLLQHVRWQFLSPAVLLQSCRTAKLRRCTTTKTALNWLLGQGHVPPGTCERRRHAYGARVQNNHPMKQATIIEWLLGGADDEADKRVHAAEARVQELQTQIRVLEARMQEAEECCHVAEAQAQEAQEANVENEVQNVRETLALQAAKHSHNIKARLRAAGELALFTEQQSCVAKAHVKERQECEQVAEAPAQVQSPTGESGKSVEECIIDDSKVEEDGKSVKRHKQKQRKHRK